MKKFLWVIFPSVNVGHFENKWRSISDKWTPPDITKRWLRSYGSLRSSPLELEPKASLTPIALEEIWCDDGDAERLRGFLLDYDYGLAGHLAAFSDLELSRFALTDEFVVIDGPHYLDRGVTNSALWRHRSDLTRAQAQAHWRDIHAPIVARDGGITRYVQYFVEDSDFEFDGCPVIYFENEKMRDTFVSSDCYRQHQLPDASNFMDPENVLRFELKGNQIDLHFSKGD